jgi:hypothetical protein
MKLKTNKKAKTITRTRRPRARQFSAQYLAIVLAAVLLIEGVSIGSVSAQNWRFGVQVLDMSAGVSQTVSDMSVALAPAVLVVRSVNNFYSLAATEMAYLLDASDQAAQLADIYNGVASFYNQASSQMALLLDASGPTGQVSGIWIGN